MALPRKTKQSRDLEDFDVDFTKYLPDGDYITSVVVELDIAGELVITSYQNQSPIIKVWASAGTDGHTYKITVRIGTFYGRIKEQEFRLRIKDL